MHACYICSSDYTTSMHLSVYASVICSFYLFVFYTTVVTWWAWVFYLICFYFAGLLNNNFTTSIYDLYTMLGKFYFCLSCVNSKPYQSVAYSPWSTPKFTTNRAWAYFYGNVSWHIVNSDSVQLVIACTMHSTGLLALHHGGIMISFSPHHSLLPSHDPHVPLNLLCMTWVFYCAPLVLAT